MSFIYTILGSVADTAGFSKAGETWASERLKTLGAQSVAASQIIMGGELAGKVLISFETKTIDAAMSLQTGIYADKELVSLIRDTGVSIDRRNLMRRQAEFGERSGQYLSALYVNSESVDDGTAQKNFARPWENMKKGANGLATLQLVVGGQTPFSHVVLCWLDSADSFYAASTKNFDDPAVKQMMKELNVKVVGRVLGRRLF